MMKKSTINNCSISSSNVYNNTSGIDFDKVYSDYNFSLLTIQDTAFYYYHDIMGRIIKDNNTTKKGEKIKKIMPLKRNNALIK